MLADALVIDRNDGNAIGRAGAAAGAADSRKKRRSSVPMVSVA
jgi:hypothetical protein